jgi:enoyl-CoA hydratase
MFVQLRAHEDQIAKRTETVGHVALRGTRRAFSAGHDLKDIRSGETPPHPHFQGETAACLSNLLQPVIVAVHGYCYTGAL